MPETPDFEFTNFGTVVRVKINTAAALDWVGENLEIDISQVTETHRLDDGGLESFTFVCDHRNGWGLCDILEDDGRFIVSVAHPHYRPPRSVLAAAERVPHGL